MAAWLCTDHLAGAQQGSWSQRTGPSRLPAPTLLQPRGDDDGILLFSTAALQASEDFAHFWERVNKGRLSAPPQETGGQCRGASRGVGAAASVIFTDEGVDDLKQVLLVSLLAR